jgi:serine/threonine-protein kinase
MGVAWRARDRRLGRDVAVKVLHPWIAEDTAVVERFEREAALLAKLSHSNIVRVYDFEAAGEQSYLVMELIEGKSLGKILAERKRLEWRVACRHLAAVAQALAFAHARGIVHRDLTPSNILVEAEGERVVVSDFGLARVARAARSLTPTGILIGTPEYWSPEQAMGVESGDRTDVYALGCILFEALSGRLPFLGDDRFAVGLRRAHEDAPSLESVTREVPREVADLTAAFLTREPGKRPSAADAARKLAVHVETTKRKASSSDARKPGPRAGGATAAPTVVRPSQAPTLRAPSRRPKWRRRLVLTAVTTAVIALVAGLALLTAATDSDRSDTLPQQASSPQTFDMPRLIDLSEVRARQLVGQTAERAGVTGIDVVENARAYSEIFKTGTVISQRPGPGKKVSVDTQEIRIQVSLGSAIAVIPQVVGKTEFAARTLLARRGFDVTRRFAPSWNAREGLVIAAHPAPRAHARRPGPVRITVSSGPPEAVVPDVTGSSLTAAARALQAKRFRYATRYRSSTTYEPGYVLSQDPRGGSSRVIGTTVTLIVSKRPEWVEIFSESGSNEYQSPPVRVPDKWRIVYRVVSTSNFGLGFASFSWQPDFEYFQADADGELHVFNASSGAGTYRIRVSPYDSRWSFSVQGLQ